MQYWLIPIAFFAVWIIIAILIAVWVYRDAEKRGESGALWLIIVLITGIIGLIIWLIIRRDKPVSGWLQKRQTSDIAKFLFFYFSFSHKNLSSYPKSLMQLDFKKQRIEHKLRKGKELKRAPIFQNNQKSNNPEND